MKKRRFPLALAILLPMMVAIFAGEFGLYSGAYFVLNDTLTQNAIKDDVNDLSALNESLTEEGSALVGYGAVPPIYAYEQNKPAQPFVPGSAEEKAYHELISKETYSQLYESLEKRLERYVTTFVGIFYEDVETNRFVLVCSSNIVGDPSNTRDQKTSLQLGDFFDKPAFASGDSFYGETIMDKYGPMFTSGLFLGDVKHPVRQDMGGPYRVWLVRETATSDVYAPLPRFTQVYAIVASIVGVALLGLIFALLYVVIVKPSRALAKDGNRYIHSLQEGDAKDVFSPSKSRYSNEMTDLNNALYFTQEAIRDYSVKIRDSAAYEERIKADLSLAERIQSSMVPTEPLYLSRCALHGYMRPAREVGGDMYSYFPIDEDRVAFFIGDVSGKGVPAALFMAKAEALLHVMAPELDVNRVNALLCQGNDEFLFVTAFIGVLNQKTGLLRFVNCGHEPTFLYHDGAYDYLGGKTNFALGCDDDFDFPIEERKLSPGDRLYLYTDGVSEAMNENGDMFGKQRILNALNASQELSGEDLLLTMQAAVSAFVGEAEQSDDICMVSVGFDRESALSFEPSIEGLKEIAPFIDEFLAEDSDSFRAEINVILDELCSNVVFYSKTEDAHVRLVLRDDRDSVYCTIIDSGLPFDPTTDRVEHDPDKPGGLGIIMAKSMSDELHYRRIRDKNVLQFRKKRG